MGLAPYPWLERPAEVLAKMLNKLPGGILIYGPRGCGVFELASRFAAAVVCQHPVDGAPCGICEECKLIFSGNHPDLRYVLSETEAALHPEPWNGKFGEIPKGKSLSKQILIEQVRGIGEYLSVTAHRAGHRAVVIYPADSMSGDQSSALLKTLEEPPSYVIFILATTEAHKIPITILSRCQRYDFRRISIDTITARLRELMDAEQVTVEDRALRYIAKAGDGSMRDALSLLDQCIAFYLGQELTYDKVLDTLGAVDTEIFSRLLRQILDKNITGGNPDRGDARDRRTGVRAVCHGFHMVSAQSDAGAKLGRYGGCA